MSKTIKSLRDDAETKKEMWSQIANDPTALKDRDKTREDALSLSNYYEGRSDAFFDVICMKSTW